MSRGNLHTKLCRLVLVLKDNIIVKEIGAKKDSFVVFITTRKRRSAMEKVKSQWRFKITTHIQSNLGYRTILFSIKSVFDQMIRDVYISDFEHKFGSRPNREKLSEHERAYSRPRKLERAMMLHPSGFEFKAISEQTCSLLAE